jgi:Domain of unknown function (DUF6429)/Family of unknown function (DUF5678)
MRDQLLSQYQGQWIAFADGAVIAAAPTPLEVFLAVQQSGRHPFVIRVGHEDEPWYRIRRASVTYGEVIVNSWKTRSGLKMELDTNKIDDAVLALLYLGLHDGARAWKGFDWEAMNRLHEQGYITDPRCKAKSVIFTEEGFERAKRLLEELFCMRAEPKAADRGRPSRGAWG